MGRAELTVPRPKAITSRDIDALVQLKLLRKAL
jgi:hypothetical protein